MIGSLNTPLATLRFTKAGRFLAAGFISNVLNLLAIEPKSTSIMFSRYKLEKQGKTDTDQYKSLARSFGKMHGISSLTNLVSLISAFGVMWELALAVPSLP